MKLKRNTILSAFGVAALGLIPVAFLSPTLQEHMDVTVNQTELEQRGINENSIYIEEVYTGYGTEAIQSVGFNDYPAEVTGPQILPGYQIPSPKMDETNSNADWDGLSKLKFDIDVDMQWMLDNQIAIVMNYVSGSSPGVQNPLEAQNSGTTDKLLFSPADMSVYTVDGSTGPDAELIDNAPSTLSFELSDAAGWGTRWEDAYFNDFEIGKDYHFQIQFIDTTSLGGEITKDSVVTDLVVDTIDFRFTTVSREELASNTPSLEDFINGSGSVPSIYNNYKFFLDTNASFTDDSITITPTVMVDTSIGNNDNAGNQVALAIAAVQILLNQEGNGIAKGNVVDEAPRDHYLSYEISDTNGEFSDEEGKPGDVESKINLEAVAINNNGNGGSWTWWQDWAVEYVEWLNSDETLPTLFWSDIIEAAKDAYANVSDDLYQDPSQWPERTGVNGEAYTPNNQIYEITYEDIELDVDTIEDLQIGSEQKLKLEFNGYSAGTDYRVHDIMTRDYIPMEFKDFSTSNVTETAAEVTVNYIDVDDSVDTVTWELIDEGTGEQPSGPSNTEGTISPSETEVTFNESWTGLEAGTHYTLRFEYDQMIRDDNTEQKVLDYHFTTLSVEPEINEALIVSSDGSKTSLHYTVTIDHLTESLDGYVLEYKYKNLNTGYESKWTDITNELVDDGTQQHATTSAYINHLDPDTPYELEFQLIKTQDENQTDIDHEIVDSITAVGKTNEIDKATEGFIDNPEVSVSGEGLSRTEIATFDYVGVVNTIDIGWTTGLDDEVEYHRINSSDITKTGTREGTIEIANFEDYSGNAYGPGQRAQDGDYIHIIANKKSATVGIPEQTDDLIVTEDIISTQVYFSGHHNIANLNVTTEAFGVTVGIDIIGDDAPETIRFELEDEYLGHEPQEIIVEPDDGDTYAEATFDHGIMANWGYHVTAEADYINETIVKETHALTKSAPIDADYVTGVSLVDNGEAEFLEVKTTGEPKDINIRIAGTSEWFALDETHTRAGVSQHSTTYNYFEIPEGMDINEGDVIEFSVTGQDDVVRNGVINVTGATEVVGNTVTAMPSWMITVIVIVSVLALIGLIWGFILLKRKRDMKKVISYSILLGYDVSLMDEKVTVEEFTEQVRSAVKEELTTKDEKKIAKSYKAIKRVSVRSREQINKSKAQFMAKEMSEKDVANHFEQFAKETTQDIELSSKVEIEDMSVRELKSILEDKGVEGYKSLNKSELVKLVKENK